MNVIALNRKKGFKQRRLIRSVSILSRLSISFGLLVLMLIIVSAVCIYSLNLQYNFNSKIIAANTAPLECLKNMSSSSAKLFLSVKELASKKIMPKANDPAIAKIAEHREAMLAYTDQYIVETKELLEKEKQIAGFLKMYTEEDLQELEKNIANIETFQKYLITTYLPKVERIISSLEEQNEILYLITSNNVFDGVFETMDGMINTTYNAHMKSSGTSLGKVSGMKSQIVTVIWVMGAIIIVVAIILAMNIVTSIKNPLKNLVDITDKISNGQLDVDMNDQSRDEIGILYRSYRRLVDTLNLLKTELSSLVSKQIEGIDYSNEAICFDGVFAEIFSQIIKMLNNEKEVMNKTIHSITAIGNGDFDVNMEAFPGEKFKFNVAVDTLRMNLKRVNVEINHLVEACIGGNLKVRCKEESFQGGWLTLVTGLNELMEKFVDPIDEATVALDKFSQGNLSERISKEYNGDFAKIKNSLNSATDEINIYIKDISDTLYQMSNENFDIEVKQEYAGDFATIKSSLNLIINTFNEILKNIKRKSDVMLKDSRGIVNSSTKLSEISVQQFQDISQMNQKMEQIMEQTNQTSSKAKTADQLAHMAKENAKKGDAHMHEMLKSMQQIQESSQNISKIIKVISEIAFQTNILALNAAVEAARAGAAGKGFVIVAEEVRNLATRSSKAVAETTELIEVSLVSVNDGSKITSQTAKVLNQIMDDIDNISTIITDISSTSQEQNTSIRQITNEMTGINDLIKSNVEVHREETESALKLEREATAFKDSVLQYKLKPEVVGKYTQ